MKINYGRSEYNKKKSCKGHCLFSKRSIVHISSFWLLLVNFAIKWRFVNYANSVKRIAIMSYP